VSTENKRKLPASSLNRTEICGLKVPRELRCLNASTPRSISFLEIKPISEEITLKVFKFREDWFCQVYVTWKYQKDAVKKWHLILNNYLIIRDYQVNNLSKNIKYFHNVNYLYKILIKITGFAIIRQTKSL
jgi:hypothetical protein